MKPSRKEAEESLEEIRAIGSRVRRMAVGAVVPVLMWIWGAIMLLGYAATYFLVRSAKFRYINPMWGGLVLLGAALTTWACINHPIQSPHKRKILWLWGLVVYYLILWGFFTRGIGPYAFNAMLMTAIMFGWAILGLISGGMIWVWLALAISGLIAAGYWLLAPGDGFWIWMSLATGGMTLLAGTWAAMGKSRNG